MLFSADAALAKVLREPRLQWGRGRAGQLVLDFAGQELEALRAGDLVGLRLGDLPQQAIATRSGSPPTVAVSPNRSRFAVPFRSGSRGTAFHASRRAATSAVWTANEYAQVVNRLSLLKLSSRARIARSASCAQSSAIWSGQQTRREPAGRRADATRTARRAAGSP